MITSNRMIELSVHKSEVAHKLRQMLTVGNITKQQLMQGCVDVGCSKKFDSTGTEFVLADA